MAEPKTTEGLVSRYAPGLAVLRNYRREWLAGDLLAGVSVCIVMIPAVIAYAELIGVAPQHGFALTSGAEIGRLGGQVQGNKVNATNCN